ncbi:PepSY domain-containing protein [Xanthomonas sp. XNM01]|uniref:PepSY domain-containing protein n=1 Tax=Xanthomonas sp. XNM01 TaxID=2769289 RepID=UPI0017814FBE|nr:PepSY domain-containing protein [Xanthomonas sp. XNM01]MBD9369704.1 PepSY domain-containing protein [Xanthomonas sp. XNM01]
MKKRLIVVAGLLAIAASVPALAIGGAVIDVQKKLADAGYRDIHDIEHDDGLWEADVTRPDGSRGDVAIDLERGEIFDARGGRALLGADAVLAKVAALGYRDVTSLDRDGALWDVDATGPDGRRMDLRLSGHDGRLLHSKPDRD